MPWCQNGHRMSLGDGSCDCGAAMVLICGRGHEIIEDVQRPNSCTECAMAYPWATPDGDLEEFRV